MPALALLTEVQNFISAAMLTPPANIGVAEPVDETAVPTIIISLDFLNVPSIGLGEHKEVVKGALAVSSIVDLANPILTNSDNFSLLSPDRTTLTLLHGGLVERDGSDTPLQASDIQVDLDNNPFTLTNHTPVNEEFAVNPASGQLLFSTPLPEVGIITAHYFIGQWERTVNQLEGDLVTRVIAGDINDTETLSNNLIKLLVQSHLGITGINGLTIKRISAITPIVLNDAPVRHRQMNWHFDFEHIENQPLSSGSIIQRIMLRTQRDNFPFEEEDIT